MIEKRIFKYTVRSCELKHTDHCHNALNYSLILFTYIFLLNSSVEGCLDRRLAARNRRRTIRRSRASCAARNVDGREVGTMLGCNEGQLLGCAAGCAAGEDVSRVVLTAVQMCGSWTRTWGVDVGRDTKAELGLALGSVEGCLDRRLAARNRRRTI